MDKHAYCARAHTHTGRAVSKGFARHVIRHLLHVTSCTSACLVVEKAKVEAPHSVIDFITKDLNESIESED